MSLEYAPRGLVGMLTPQANTTVEPELNLLWPPGITMLSARLISDGETLASRLMDYFEQYEISLRQFGDAPISAAAAACTGASYLAGRKREKELMSYIAERRAYPFITAASAVVDALSAIQAQQIGLISPYPDDLNEASIGYWESHGFLVKEVARTGTDEKSFHPVYSLSGSAVGRALQTLEYKRFDAIVMLGTGMPTLRPIASTIGWNGAPVMSSNLCLAWRVVTLIDNSAPSAGNLNTWLKGEFWALRISQPL
jgi:maleate isomerase